MKRFSLWLLVSCMGGVAHADVAAEWAKDQKDSALAWQDSTSALVTAIRQSCDGKPVVSEESHLQLMSYWAPQVEAWGVVASQHLTAIDELGLGYRLAFWPDSRGVVARQMGTHLQQRQSGTYEDLQLAGQGIQAVDWLLAQDQPDCQLLQDWARHYEGYVAQVVDALPEALHPAERALTIAANDLYAQASRLNQRLKEVIAEENGRYRPFMGDFSETGQSIRFLRAGLHNLGDRLVLFSQQLPDNRMAGPTDQLRTELVALAESLPEGWPAEAEQAWAMAERIRATNRKVEDWLGEDVANTYSLLIGFNNQDGD